MENQKLTIGPFAYQQLTKIHNPVIVDLLDMIEISEKVHNYPGSIIIMEFGSELSVIVKSYKGKEKKDNLKTGKLFRLLFDHYKIVAKSSVLETVYNELKASLLDLDIQVVKGEDIKKYYNQENYLHPGYFETPTFEGSLSKSCMRFPFCSSWLDFYSKNEGVVELWVLLNEEKLEARALVWTDINGRKLLDRIYYTTMEQAYYFMGRAKQLGYMYVDTPTWDPERDPIILSSDGNVVEQVTVRLLNKSMYEFPYLDALPYYNISEGIITSDCRIPEKRDAIIKMKSLNGRIKLKHIIRWPGSRESKISLWASTVPLLSEKNGEVSSYKEIYSLILKYPHNIKQLLKYSRIENRHNMLADILSDKNLWMLEYYNFTEEVYGKEYMQELWQDKHVYKYLIKNSSAYWSLGETKFLDLLNEDPLILFKPCQRAVERVKSHIDFFSFNKNLHDYLLTRSTTERNSNIATFETNITRKINFSHYIFKYNNVDNWLYYMKFRWWKKDYQILVQNLNTLESSDSDKILNEILVHPIFIRLITEIKKEVKNDLYIIHWANKLKI